MLPTSYSKIRNLLFAVKIQGTSMMPELVPGRLYLASKLKRPKVGRAVVFTHGQQTFIKKILSITPAGYQVAGTTSFATSSQDLGLISKNKIIGAIL